MGKRRIRDEWECIAPARRQHAAPRRYSGAAQQETQLAALAQTAAGLRARQQQAQQSLDALIQGLSFDADVAAPPAAR